MQTNKPTRQRKLLLAFAAAMVAGACRDAPRESHVNASGSTHRRKAEVERPTQKVQSDGGQAPSLPDPGFEPKAGY
jgi:hypothetical protein